MEGLDPVLIELQRLIVDGTDKIFSGGRYFVQNRPHFRIFPGPRKHEGGELFAREGARPVEESAFQVFMQSDIACVESGKGEIVPILKFFPIQAKRGGGLFA